VASGPKGPESARDNLSVVSAGCAFYALFAIFPALSALISLYGIVANPADVERHFGILVYVLPPEAYDLIFEQIRRVAETPSQTLGWGLVVSLGLALWISFSASHYHCRSPLLNVATREGPSTKCPAGGLGAVFGQFERR
jgi:uncharacterized BrkB/YihY/UPF0761 family membrane protein